MALYVKADTVWQVSDTSDGTQIQSKRSSSKVDDSTSSEYVEGVLSLADGATDVSVNFGSITTAKAVHIETDRAISIKINGSATAIPIGHTDDAAATFQIDATNITSLSLSNASGAAASVKYSMPGI